MFHRTDSPLTTVTSRTSPVRSGSPQLASLNGGGGAVVAADASLAVLVTLERHDAVVAKSKPVPRRARAQDVDRHVGARMRERRVMLGLTQQQMAELIGVTYQQAHKYEKGINRVAAGRLYNIAQALGVDMSYFFEGLI